jgi:hypothetical protein
MREALHFLSLHAFMACLTRGENSIFFCLYLHSHRAEIFPTVAILLFSAYQKVPLIEVSYKLSKSM